MVLLDMESTPREEYVIKEEVNVLEKELNVLNDDDIDLPDVGNRHVVVTPLVEVFSVSIHCNQEHNSAFSDGKPCHIYGTIRVTDGRGTSFCLYNRSWNEPETVYLNDTISLTGPDKDAILPSTMLEVEVDLKDKFRGIDIAKGIFSLDYTTEYNYDDRISKRVEGKYSYANVHYTTFRFAITAIVDVVFTKQDDGGGGVTDIYGRLVARSSVRSPDNGEEKEDYFSSMLFKKQRDESVRVESGSSLKLSRHLVAVPVHSSLEIELYLADNGSTWKISKRTLEFIPQDGHGFSDMLDVYVQGGLVRVKVTWYHAYDQLKPAGKLKLGIEEVSNPKREEINVEDLRKRPRLDQQPLSTFSNYQSSPSATRSPIRLREERLEVFSVYIVCYDGEPCRVHGTIIVDDGLHEAFLFERGEDCPDIVGPSGKLLLDIDSDIFGGDFAIKVDLKDVSGRVISKGWMAYQFLGGRKYWFDKPICSIIRGNHGYAAFHYSVFSDSVAATIKVLFHNVGGLGCVNVCGKVVAQYSNYKYSTPYGREYCRSVLFQNNLPEELTSDSEIRLSRSVVAVPVGWVLEIEVDLEVKFHSELALNGVPEVETLKGTVKLESKHEGESSQVLSRKNHHIQVLVEWKDKVGS